MKALRDGLDDTERRLLSRLGDNYVRCSKVVEDEEEYDDPPADAEYSEARLTPLAHALPHFPNLLVNGSATIPPHTLREVAAGNVIAPGLPDRRRDPGSGKPACDLRDRRGLVAPARPRARGGPGADAQALLADLYARDVLEVTIDVDMTALVDGTPKRLTLPELLGPVAPDIAERFGDARRTGVGET